MRKLSTLVGALVALAVLAAGPAWAQPEKNATPTSQTAPPAVQGPKVFGKHGPRYNPQAVETLTGKVVMVKRRTARRPGRPAHVTLTLRTAKGNVRVALGPADYIDQQSLKLAAGDQVQVKGVKVTRFNRSMFIAGEVKKGDQVLKLRDAATGRPLWAKGMKKSKGS